MTGYSPQQIVVALLVGGGVAVSSLTPSPPSVRPTAVAGRSEGGVKISRPSSLNLNRATWEDLHALPGIGPVLAARIVEYREEHGPFTSTEELTRVAGIGVKRLSQISPFLRVETTP